MDASQVYLSVVTLFACIHLPTPTFGFARVTDPAFWGQTFSFLASANHAILVNTALLGLNALARGKRTSTRVIDLHVVLFGLTYVALLVLNFLLWHSHVVQWSSVIPGMVELSMDQYQDATINGTTVATDAKIASARYFTSFDAPQELLLVTALPPVIMNLVLLPFTLWTSSARCVVVGASEPSSSAA